MHIVFFATLCYFETSWSYCWALSLYTVIKNANHFHMTVVSTNVDQFLLTASYTMYVMRVLRLLSGHRSFVTQTLAVEHDEERSQLLPTGQSREGVGQPLPPCTQVTIA